MHGPSSQRLVVQGPVFSITRWARPAAYVIAALLSLVAGLIAWHEWPPQFQVPIVRGGDTISAHYLIKTIIDHGWYLVNPDTAAPFSATMYDYPIPEPFTQSLIWLLGRITSDPFTVFNLFYFAGFISVAWAACWAFVRCGMPLSLACAGAITYAILPYHFLRLAHVFLAFYFAVPIFCCYALRLALRDTSPAITPARIGFGTLILLVIAAGGGVYYAFFGCVFIAAGTIYGAARHSETAALRIGAVYIATIVTVVGISLLPNFFYHLAHGGNPLVANRSPGDADVYGLTVIQMLLPTVGHRFGWARALVDRYDHYAPALLVNENVTASLGILSAIGFLIALAVCLFGTRRKRPALSAAGALAITGVLYATIGGFGAIAALLLIPDIRGLNRISVFIAFFGLFALLVVVSRVRMVRYGRLLAGIASVAMVAVACADQIPTHAMRDKRAAREELAAFQDQRAAFERLQATLSPDTAIYELPYVFYPESPAREGSYTLFVPYLYTHGFRWSFGGMHGRIPDQWNEQVSKLSGHSFSTALAGSGFGAVYVDGNGYADHGAAINQQMATLFGPPIWKFDNKSVYQVEREPGAYPYVIAGFGRGWYSEESALIHGTRNTWHWSQGDAVLRVANPGHKSTRVALHFELATVLPRHVSIRYTGRILGSYQLQPGRHTHVWLDIDAAPGISGVQLTTDVPARKPDNTDPRKLAFRVIDLTVGPFHTGR